MISVASLYLNQKLKAGMTIQPSGLLKRCISHYSFTLAYVSDRKDKLGIIPDASGCLVFIVDDVRMDSAVWGPTTEMTYVYKASPKPALMFMIEFLQGGLKYFMDENPKDLKNRIVRLDEVNHEMSDFFQDLYQKSDSLSAFLEGVELYLSQKLINQLTMEAFDYAIDLVKCQGSSLTVSRLAAATNYSDRQLSRIFNERMGMSVKSFMKLVRINRIITQLKTDQSSVKALLMEQEYFDQAHFIKDFKAICGVTPKVFCSQMSGFYNEKLKF